MTPEQICTQSAKLLRLISDQTDITKDPAELAALLRTAAESCSQVEAHNSFVKMMSMYPPPK